MNVEVVVLGGGLVGTLLVQALHDRGIDDLLWIDAGDAQASQVPCALVHPFAGRSFQPRPGVFEAWRASHRFFERYESVARVHWAMLHRPWVGPSGARLRESWSRWSHRAVDELAALSFEPQPDAITYGPVFAFEPSALVAVLTDRLKARGIQIRTTRVSALVQGRDGWTLSVAEGSPVRSQHVVVSAGAGSVELLGSYTRRLEVHHGTLRFGPGQPPPRFVVDRGHVAASTATVAWGSSYGGGIAEQTSFLDGLEQRLATHAVTLPPSRSWSGPRVVDRSTRLPWVETIDDGLHVATAFGSQGGLWAPICAARFADAFAAGRSVDRWPVR